MWRNVGAARLRRIVDEVSLPAFSEHVLLVNVGRSFKLEEKLDGRVYRTSGVMGDVAIIPAGARVEIRTRVGKPQEIECFAMRLGPAFVRGVAEGAELDPGLVELVGVLGGRDPEIERIGYALLSELESEGLFGDVYADSLATALAVRLLRDHSSLGRRAARKMEVPGGGLPKVTLKRVTDYVEENLAHNPKLAELAGVAHMSPFHFSRTFKVSTGLSPHRYLIQRRIERAKGLLVNTDLPLMEVAHLCGFADQSHLAKHTRRLLGASPRSLRLASG